MEPEKKTILVTSRNPEVMFRFESELEKAGFDVIGCLTDPDTVLHIKRSNFSGLVIGPGVNEKSRQKIVAALEKAKPGTEVIEEYSGNEDIARAVRRAIPE